jgi:hypothetical protein
MYSTSTITFQVHVNEMIGCMFQEKAYSFESSQELLEKDIVQLHAPRWHPLRRVSNICNSIVIRLRAVYISITFL